MRRQSSKRGGVIEAVSSHHDALFRPFHERGRIATVPTGRVYQARGEDGGDGLAAHSVGLLVRDYRHHHIAHPHDEIGGEGLQGVEQLLGCLLQVSEPARRRSGAAGGRGQSELRGVAADGGLELIPRATPNVVGEVSEEELDQRGEALAAGPL